MGPLFLMVAAQTANHFLQQPRITPCIGRAAGDGIRATSELKRMVAAWRLVLFKKLSPICIGISEVTKFLDGGNIEAQYVWNIRTSSMV